MYDSSKFLMLYTHIYITEIELLIWRRCFIKFNGHNLFVRSHYLVMCIILLL